MHEEWRERKVIRKIIGMERMKDLLFDVQINSMGDDLGVLSPGNMDTRSGDAGIVEMSPTTRPNESDARFLNYAPVRIFDFFFASRLNNWRATQLLISLIEDPMWGLYNGTRFVCAVDLCRTHAALGEERNFLGAEKAVGLYLAGVVFGGPQMYEVPSPPRPPVPFGISFARLMG